MKNIIRLASQFASSEITGTFRQYPCGPDITVGSYDRTTWENKSPCRYGRYVIISFTAEGEKASLRLEYPTGHHNAGYDTAYLVVGNKKYRNQKALEKLAEIWPLSPASSD